MNKKILAVGLIVILAASIAIVTVTYFQKQSNHEAKEANTYAYTIEGTLCLFPSGVSIPGISATNIFPSVSPWPLNITVTNEGLGFPEVVNITVPSFIFLTFPSAADKISFPVGFESGDTVKISGQMTYNLYYESYYMIATSIIHISS